MKRNWVLLRGLIRERRHWQGFDQHLQRTMSGDRVIAMDLPGNGDLYQEASPDRIEGMVASLRQQLSAQGLEPPFHVVSLSLGAMTTISWLAEYPGEVAGAVLINTSVARFSPFWRRLRYQNYARVLRALMTASRVERERLILSITSNHLDDGQRRALAREWADLAAQKPVSRRNALRQLRAAARFHAPAAWPGAVPGLVLAGEGDRLVDPGCSRALAGAWSLPLQTHPTAGHDLTLDAPEWAAQAVSDWAARLPRTAS